MPCTRATVRKVSPIRSLKQTGRSALCFAFLLVCGGAPAAGVELLVNGDFESSPFPFGWNGGGGVVSTAGFNGSATAARLPWNTGALLNQRFDSVSNFTCELLFQVAGDWATSGFNGSLSTSGGAAVRWRTGAGGRLQLFGAGEVYDLTRTADDAPFHVPANTTVRLRVAGRGFGTARPVYDLAWSDPGGSLLAHSATGLTVFVSSENAAAGGVVAVSFDRPDAAAHSYAVDDVSVIDAVLSVPDADYRVEMLAVVRISGVYPHLAMSNSSGGEVGVGAVCPWAGKLWTMTYSAHAPTGSSDKLYEIAPDLSRVVRDESIGGTPACRFVHRPSQQLVIGPYFIDTNRNVRVLSYATAPGRHTGIAAHLSDPANRLYFFTMEDGVYDVNVHDLSVITRYPDVQSRGDRFLFGYHGKGAYSGQGVLVVANNGRPNLHADPGGASGVLASWNGTTVADNGGVYFADNDPNNTAEEVTTQPVAPQPQFIAGWNQHYKVQHCEVTGPGGIYGNSDPANDPLWATGFDEKSVVLRVMESPGIWHTWRLPKGSYSHDGSHGWYTEWPRIRQLDPDDPQSPYLMHMHGLFYNFPGTFSTADFSALTPLCSYYKMPTDYCLWEGMLVIGKDDASLFNNPLLLRAQSSLWFGELDDLAAWGAPHGHGSLWRSESVAAAQHSDPFLIGGFSEAILHLRHTTAQAVSLELQECSGDGVWRAVDWISVPPAGYVFRILDASRQPWVRLKTLSEASGLTASLLVHTRRAVAGDDPKFAALAEIGDATGYSDGVIRAMAGADLELELAAMHCDGSGQSVTGGYFRAGGALRLRSTADAAAEAGLRADAATSLDFGFDEASAWVMAGTQKLRLPKLDSAYEQPFPSGWPRGFREVVTERSLLNCHGTFYEIPRASAGGLRKLRPLATHGRRITDFMAWRGLLVLSGVRDDAPASEHLLRGTSGGGALWLGEVDDIWRLGLPRGWGGPWRDAPVAAGAPSDAYLMYGYLDKKLTLSHHHNASVTFTVEVDFLADAVWSEYERITVAPGCTAVHHFPDGFHAYWVRLVSDTDTVATAEFVYGGAMNRGTVLRIVRN